MTSSTQPGDRPEDAGGAPGDEPRPATGDPGAAPSSGETGTPSDRTRELPDADVPPAAGEPTRELPVDDVPTPGHRSPPDDPAARGQTPPPATDDPATEHRSTGGDTVPTDDPVPGGGSVPADDPTGHGYPTDDAVPGGGPIPADDPTGHGFTTGDGPADHGSPTVEYPAAESPVPGGAGGHPTGAERDVGGTAAGGNGPGGGDFGPGLGGGFRDGGPAGGGFGPAHGAGVPFEGAERADGFEGGGERPEGSGWRPPPISAFAFRHRLVRPRTGRKMSGVCAGLGAATGTDPTLWRVILAILTLFGGVGALAYALAWVAMPGQGDEVAPLEALVGRGRSRTPAVLTVLLCAVAVALVFFVFNSGFRFTVLVASIAAVVAVLMYRRNQQRSGAAPDATTVPPGTRYSGPLPADGPARPGWQPPAPQPGYQAPFAPHGPYQQGPAGPGESGPATAAPVGAGEIPLNRWNDQVPPPPPPPPPGRRKRPRERSMLGRLTLLAGCVVIGSLIVLAVAGVPVPPDVYIGAALAVVGGGLLVGAWRGRARWLIIIGCVLALALPVARFSDSGPSPARHWDNGRYPAQERMWSPTEVHGIAPRYHTDVGDATLDLSAVNFGGADRDVTIDADVGDVDVILPPDVDVTVRLHEGVGDATLFGRPVSDERRGRPGGPGGRHDVVSRTDYGVNGPGGGTLKLDVTADIGDVGVHR